MQSCQFKSQLHTAVLSFHCWYNLKTFAFCLDHCNVFCFIHFSIFIIIVRNLSGLQFFLICLYTQIDCLFLPRTFPLLSDNNTIKWGWGGGALRTFCFFAICEQTENGNKASYLCLTSPHYISIQTSQTKHFLALHTIIIVLNEISEMC